MPIENVIILGVVGAAMVGFMIVTFWLATESGAARKRERQMSVAE